MFGKKASRIANFRVRPRAAAKWLLRKPKREHLVPPSLRAFLEVKEQPDIQATLAASVRSGQRRGFPNRASRNGCCIG
jgi:hypothetical protein